MDGENNIFVFLVHRPAQYVCRAEVCPGILDRVHVLFQSVAQGDDLEAGGGIALESSQLLGRVARQVRRSKRQNCQTDGLPGSRGVLISQCDRANRDDGGRGCGEPPAPRAGSEGFSNFIRVRESASTLGIETPGDEAIPFSAYVY